MGGRASFGGAVAHPARRIIVTDHKIFEEKIDFICLRLIIKNYNSKKLKDQYHRKAPDPP
jgi:hypothetical protein